MNVFIIPEDFRKDQFILKPIIGAMLNKLGIHGTVRVCQEPLLGGVGEALKWERIREILEERQAMIDLFILVVDRDGIEGRQQRLRDLEVHARAILPDAACLIAENAWQEVEVWVLAGHTLPSHWSWNAIRAEPNPKEVYFTAFAQSRDVAQELGGGRKTLASEAAKHYRRIHSRCPEDVANLEARVRAWMETRP